MQLSPKIFGQKNVYSLFYLLICLSQIRYNIYHYKVYTMYKVYTIYKVFTVYKVYTIYKVFTVYKVYTTIFYDLTMQVFLDLFKLFIVINN